MQLHGIGLQLSYLGTIGIIVFYKNIKHFLDELKFLKDNVRIRQSKLISKIVNALKEMLSVTISAQIMILPVMLYHFNMMGIYFIITNILVSSIIGPIMFLSVIFVIMSCIHLEISKCIPIFLSLGIEGLIQIPNLAKFPFSKIYVVTPSILFIIIYYIIVLVSNQIYVIYTSKHVNGTQRRVKNLIALVKYKLYEKKKKKWKIYKIIFLIIVKKYKERPFQKVK